MRIHNIQIDRLTENSVITISNEQESKMLFVCKCEGENSWRLISPEYGDYCPIAVSLDELKEILQEDWLNGDIFDIQIFSTGGDFNG